MSSVEAQLRAELNALKSQLQAYQVAEGGPWSAWSAWSMVCKGERNGGSINGGTPKWMVYKGKSHLEMFDLGVPQFMEAPISSFIHLFNKNV